MKNPNRVPALSSSAADASPAARKRKDQQDDYEDQKYQREHESGVVGALRKRQQIASPWVAATNSPRTCR